MADYSQKPDILNGKGTVVDFKDYDTLGSLRRAIADLLGVPPSLLVGELNHYFDLKNCGIRFHGDEERRLVIGVRVGASMCRCGSCGISTAGRSGSTGASIWTAGMCTSCPRRLWVATRSRRRAS